MLQASLFAAACILLSCIGLLVVKKVFPVTLWQRQNESSGIYIAVITLLYSLTMAFVVSSIWTDYEENNDNIENESERLADMYSYAEQLSNERTKELHLAIEAYTGAVVLAMDSNGNQRLNQMEKVHFSDLRETIFKRDSLHKQETEVLLHENFIALRDLRARRLEMQRAHVPSIVWFVLIIGSLISLFSTYFIQTSSVRVQLLFTALLSGLMSLMLYTGYALDHPFSGPAKISTQAFKNVQEYQFRSNSR